MSIRPDLTINWAVSPRIIEVAAPSIQLSVQDLYDTLRSLGAEAIDEPEIIDGSGKESLGAGVLVGLTIKLLNAKVKFEDRTGPSWVVCSIGEGNLVAVDEGGDPINPVEPSAYTQVQVVMSAAGTITITGSGVTEQDKIDIADKVEVLTGAPIKAQTDNLPADPASKADLETVHGAGSWEGATPLQVWGHSDRKLTSRDIESLAPGEHLPSEEQVLNINAILDAIKGLGFESTEDALRVIRQLVQTAGRGGATFSI